MVISAWDLIFCVGSCSEDADGNQGEKSGALPPPPSKASFLSLALSVFLEPRDCRM